jgi:hypothetical protein
MLQILSAVYWCMKAQLSHLPLGGGIMMKG